MLAAVEGDTFGEGLPHELQVKALRLLDRVARVQASVVCSSWRRWVQVAGVSTLIGMQPPQAVPRLVETYLRLWTSVFPEATHLLVYLERFSGQASSVLADILAGTPKPIEAITFNDGGRWGVGYSRFDAWPATINALAAGSGARLQQFTSYQDLPCSAANLLLEACSALRVLNLEVRARVQEEINPRDVGLTRNIACAARLQQLKLHAHSPPAPFLDLRSLSSAAQLTSLQLDCMQLANFSSISSLKQLKQLQLGRIQRADSSEDSKAVDLAALSSLQQLTSLELRRFHARSPGAISHLTALQQLRLLCMLRAGDTTGNLFSGIPQLQPLTQLTSLELQEVFLHQAPDTWRVLAGLPLLSDINLQEAANMDHIGPEPVAATKLAMEAPLPRAVAAPLATAAPELQCLVLRGPDQGALVALLQGHPQPQEVHMMKLSKRPLSVADLQALASLPLLSKLTAGRLPAELPQPLAALTSLDVQHVSDEQQPAAQQQGAWAVALPALQELTIWRNSLQQLAHVLQGHQRLRRLTVSIWCGYHGGAIQWPAGLLHSLPALQVAEVGVYGLEEAVLQDAAQCSALRELVVGRAWDQFEDKIEQRLERWRGREGPCILSHSPQLDAALQTLASGPARKTLQKVAVVLERPRHDTSCQTFQLQPAVTSLLSGAMPALQELLLGPVADEVPQQYLGAGGPAAAVRRAQQVLQQAGLRAMQWAEAWAQAPECGPGLVWQGVVCNIAGGRVELRLVP